VTFVQLSFKRLKNYNNRASLNV